MFGVIGSTNVGACPHAVWYISVWLYFLWFSVNSGSPSRVFSMETVMIQDVMESAIRKWCNLTFEFSFSGFGLFHLLFFYHSYHQSDFPGVAFPLASTSWEVGYSPMNFLRFNNIGNCGQRNMNLLDVVVAFTFNMDVSHPKMSFILFLQVYKMCLYLPAPLKHHTALSVCTLTQLMVIIECSLTTCWKTRESIKQFTFTQSTSTPISQRSGFKQICAIT